MRIQILADVGKGITLPINYNHLLVGAIYRFLTESNPEYADFLHDEGYQTAEKRFKLFTFSQLMAKRRTHHRRTDTFSFYLDVVCLLSCRTIPIPFCRYPSHRRQTLHRTAPTQNQGCDDPACAAFST